jgi:MoaE-MoaD fusion protein
MHIRLLAFATAADALGTRETTVELPDGATVAVLREHLLSTCPDLTPHWPRLAVAVEGELVREDRVLAEGEEVALLPPVSGGAPEEDDGLAERARLTEEPLDAEAITDLVRRPDHGAVLVFWGTVRNHHDARPVTALTYDAYRSMATARLAAVVEDLEAGEVPIRAAIVHRLGRVEAGEPSVVIAVSSPHRDAAYQASRTALERLKAEVPIWKKEHYADGDAVWREVEPLTA